MAPSFLPPAVAVALEANIVRQLYDWVLHWADTPFGTPALGVLAFTESSFFPIPPDPLLMALALAKPSLSFYYSFVCSAASVFGGLFGYFIGFAMWNRVGAPMLRRLKQLTHAHQVVVVEAVKPHDFVVIRSVDGALGEVHRLRLHRDEPVTAAPVGQRDYEEEQTSCPLESGQTAYLMRDNYHVARGWYERHGVWIVLLAAFTPIPYKVFTILSGLARLRLLPFLVASLVGRSARFFLVGTLIFAYGQPIRQFIDRYFNLLTVLFVVLLIGGFAVMRMFYRPKAVK